MRLGWSIPLPGPFFLSGTLPGWTCPHNHRRPDTAQACAQREARRRGAR